MNQKIFILIIFVISTTCSHNILFAYDKSVHSTINEKVARKHSQLDFILKSQLSLTEGVNSLIPKDGKLKRIYQWIAYGGEAEDFGWWEERKDPLHTRAFNHFHDSLKP